MTREPLGWDVDSPVQAEGFVLCMEVEAAVSPRWNIPGFQLTGEASVHR